MDIEPVTSETPFLSKRESTDTYKSEYLTDTIQKLGWFQRNKKYILSNLIVIILCATLGAVHYNWYTSKSQCAPQSLVYTPARDSLEYIKMRMDTAGVEQSKYLGFNDEADKAWRDLTSRNHVRLSNEDLRALNQTSISLGSGGYLGMFGVYHELHCMKWIRWALAQDRYKDGLSDQEVLELPTHIIHFLDVVRQSIMCRANTAVVTYDWIEGSRMPKANYHGYSQCIDWDKFEAWADEHTVNILEPGELNYPI